MQGKVVVITGASRGIGAAAGRAFAAAGARVVLWARDAQALAALAAEIGPDHAMATPVDVAVWSDVQAATEAAQGWFGRIDVLVNNAGMIDPIARLSDAMPEDWARAVNVNLAGAFHCIRAVLPAMRAQGAGTIINVSSGAATQPLEGWSSYCASKAGLLMLTRSLHLEEAAQGIRALGLSPGTVATDMQLRIRQSGINPVSRLDPQVHVPPDRPARALVWMCGPGADPWLGGDVSLRDEGVLRAAGIVA